MNQQPQPNHQPRVHLGRRLAAGAVVLASVGAAVGLTGRGDSETAVPPDPTALEVPMTLPDTLPTTEAPTTTESVAIESSPPTLPTIEVNPVQVDQIDEATTTSSTSTSTTTTTTPTIVTTVPPETAPQTTAPETTTPTSVEVDEPPVPPEKLPDPAPITPEISALLEENGAYIDGIGCSAYVLRNADGIAVGAVTAEHCGLKSDERPRKTDEDGTRYVENYGKITVKTGRTQAELTSVGSVSKVIVQSENGTGSDFALLVFEGHEDSEVKEAYHQYDAELQKGDTAYLTGWPSDQDTNPEVFTRQNWAMSYLGPTSYVTTTTGENLYDLELFAMKSNQNGAECSFGASGSNAVTAENKHIGALAIFVELTADTFYTEEQARLNREFYEQVYGVSLEGYDVVCGFSKGDRVNEPGEFETFEMRDISYEGIYGEEIAQIKAEAMTAFQDTTLPKTYTNAWLEWHPGKGGPGLAPYIQNPIIHIDAQGDALIYWRDDSLPDGISYLYVPASELDESFILHVLPDTDILQQTSGAIVPNPVDNKVPAFVDETGALIGGQSFELPTGTIEQRLHIDEGKLVLDAPVPV